MDSGKDFSSKLKPWPAAADNILGYAVLLRIPHDVNLWSVLSTQHQKEIRPGSQ